MPSAGVRPLYLWILYAHIRDQGCYRASLSKHHIPAVLNVASKEMEHCKVVVLPHTASVSNALLPPCFNFILLPFLPCHYIWLWLGWEKKKRCQPICAFHRVRSSAMLMSWIRYDLGEGWGAREGKVTRKSSAQQMRYCKKTLCNWHHMHQYNQKWNSVKDKIVLMSYLHLWLEKVGTLLYVIYWHFCYFIFWYNLDF